MPSTATIRASDSETSPRLSYRHSEALARSGTRSTNRSHPSCQHTWTRGMPENQCDRQQVKDAA
jgi:hypothetical protein